MSEPKEIINQLRRARVSKGMAQFDLAEASGYARNTIANYEAGYRVPEHLQMLCNWADALGYRLKLEPKNED